MKYNALILICLGVLNSAYTQSLLWKISGKKITKPSYLYGTIHIQDRRVFAYDTVVKEAFEQSEVYAMEVVLDQIDKEEMESMVLMKKHTLDGFYSNEEYDQINRFCLEKIGVDLAFFKKMKPFFLFSQLMQVDMPKDMDRPLDADFLMKARKTGKKVIGIERLKDQMAAIDQIPLNSQADFLLGLVQNPKSTAESFEGLITAYLNSDFDLIQKFLSDTMLPKEFEKAILVKRNKKMAKKIAKIAQKHSSFNAIGAGHLMGQKGVVALLRKKGYTVEPIPFKFDESYKED